VVADEEAYDALVISLHVIANIHMEDAIHLYT
jgi:hypothetical protein